MAGSGRPFGAIKKEIEQQRAYYFDYEAKEAKCQGTFDQQLRDEVIAYLMVNMSRQMEGRSEHQDRWLAIEEKLAERNVAVPDRPAWDSSFRGRMHAVLSALKGHGVGWKFDTLGPQRVAEEPRLDGKMRFTVRGDAHPVAQGRFQILAAPGMDAYAIAFVSRGRRAWRHSCNVAA